MSNYLIQGETLTNIANAIRTKTGKTDSIATDNMATEISGLPIYPLYDGAVEEINLAYTLNSDGKSYSVSGIGDVTATNIRIPATYNNLPVTEIATNAFSNNNTITNLKIGNNVTKINESAFFSCKTITNLVIGDNVNSVENYAFQRCSKLNHITIPKNLKKIYQYSFYDCSNTRYIYIFDISAWCKMTGVGFLVNQDLGTNLLFLNGELITELVIPSDVTNTLPTTFKGCKEITKVILSEGVVTLSGNTFYSCTKLKTVIFPSTLTSLGADLANCVSMELCDFRKAIAVPTLSNKLFLQADPPCKIVVPDSLYDQWIVASNWSTYASKIVKASEYTEA